MGERFGGRAPGTPNKATKKVREFLDGVFDEVFADKGYRERLVKSIIDGTIDGRVFALLLSHYAGRPSVAVDLTHSGTVSLAQIIAGRVPKDDDEEPGDAPAT